ncbi:bifunctional diaminohydroxyphosphoribosylaminopyrimidine deaminase/5-amino-6-(5-phosphoribosylamino)uracil reductase RibD, partial [candidate division GN15 bacterium]|nr:bifunctional diaminohydroxyphosphoribosylaminopyrimidine deaminase/5-amino-6-(5-phosphoribosylamino)uracil reductase RibD [candidate division GN15 bacterium]
MRRALDLAEKGRGTTRPNPLVGAVIVKDGHVIAEGYHRRAGSDHAEVVALKKAGRRARGATVYVTLEPCCHTGSTGPCCDALVEAEVARVVIPVLDPNPIVSGRGARRLRKAGIELTRGVLQQEARRQNDLYFGRHQLGRPYIILKSAQTLDGRIAASNGQSQWITGKQARTIG